MTFIIVDDELETVDGTGESKIRYEVVLGVARRTPGGCSYTGADEKRRAISLWTTDAPRLPGKRRDDQSITTHPAAMFRALTSSVTQSKHFLLSYVINIGRAIHGIPSSNTSVYYFSFAVIIIFKVKRATPIENILIKNKNVT